MGRKIAVVGMSPAGLVQLSSLVKSRGRHEQYGSDEYVLIHDPDKVYNYMLSGTNPAYFDELGEVTNLTRRYLMKYANATDSIGYKYIGWGTRKDKNFFATYNHQLGSHFDIVGFRTALLKDGGQAFGDNVSIIEQRIDGFAIESDGCKINGTKYDYVIDCTEKEPLTEPGNYGFPNFCPVNTSIVVEKPEPGNWNYTIAYAAKHGHITGIPYRDKQLWIYSFDRKVHDENQIFADFATVFPDEDLKSYKWDKIEWNPCTSAYVIHESGVYCRNGAALVNTDPLTAVQQEFAQIIANEIDHWIYREDDTYAKEIYKEIQENYTVSLNDSLLGMIAYMYHLGSRHKTAFWKKAKEDARKLLTGPAFLHPGFFPGKEWIDNVLSEEWGDAEYRKLLFENDELEDVGGRISQMPLIIMSSYVTFYEIAVGLGAPYAKYLRGLENIYPPEKFGTIGYDYF